MIRCDEPMKRSKEQARSWTQYGIPKWKCTKECETCICALIQDRDGTWHHYSPPWHRKKRIII